MSSYTGRHAGFYDLFYADKPYRAEAEFVDRVLTRGGVRRGAMLELACGTGRHALEFERLGWNLTGVDWSADMLAVARQRGEAEFAKAKFLRQDMRELRVDNGPFDAAVCLFDSIGYLKDNESILSALRGVRDHLRPDGLFVFEFWHAAAMLRSFDPVRVRRFTVPGGRIVRISETTLETAKQLAHVTYSIMELRDDGTYFELRETQTNRWFLTQEMAAMLRSVGLEPTGFHAGFETDRPIDEHTWHIVASARRK